MSLTEQILELIDDEMSLCEDELTDCDAVEDELKNIAAVEDDVARWIDSVGINEAVRIVIEHNMNPYYGVIKLVGLLSRIMGSQGCSKEDIIKNADNIYEQYKVPKGERKYGENLF